MFLVNCKNIFSKPVTTKYLQRFITSTSCGDGSTKCSAEKATNADVSQKQVEVHRPLTESEIQKIVNLDNIHIATKFQTKLPQRPPLIENFFIRKIDAELLTYPQMLEVKTFHEMVKKFEPVSAYFVDNAKTPKELQFRDLSNQMVADFNRMKLPGLSVPERFSGAGFFKSEMNFASESEANDIKSFLVLAGHRLAVEAISDHGNTAQHNKYLMDMAKGELFGAVCLMDHPFNETDSNSITVSKSQDGSYILNGSRNFVVYSQHANLLIVVAKKSDELKREDDEDEDDEDFFDSYMTIIVDPKTSGITISDEYKTIGCNDVPFASIKFSNVYIEKDRILSETNDDRQISQKLLSSARIQSATLNMIQVKNMLNYLVNFSLRTECNEEKLRELQLVRDNIAKIASELYGLESMIYLTLGLVDQYDNPKVDLECAITKAYSQDLLQNVNKFMLNLLSSTATIEAHPNGFDIRDSLQLQCNETSFALKNFVGRAGTQHAVFYFGDRVEDYQDSLLSKIGATPIVDIDPTLYLGGHLHPTLIESANDLERAILRLSFGTEMLLKHFGPSVADQQLEMRALGDSVMWCYAIFASLGRASRSYCLGLRYSALETVLAQSIIEMGGPQILETILEIKHKQCGLRGWHKNIADSIFLNRKTQTNCMPSILDSGVLQKTRK